ncbi:VOC family protein [Streptomyces sp. NPDC004041]|uniref:VOC family protein n=1 Tax=Streptomyces sp. NPDC004041 TaxID=3364688 RepID=UPI0036C6049F
MESAADPASHEQLSLQGVDHLAHVTWDPDATVLFYRDALGLPLVHAVTGTGWLSESFPDFVHFFFGLGKGNHLAFFYFFGLPRDQAPDDLMHRSRHLALRVETEEELLAWRRKLKAAGIRVTPPLAHEMIESIYFDDPNGIQLEITRPLREFGDVDARDAALTVAALTDVVRKGDPSLKATWQRKGELIADRFERGNI